MRERCKTRTIENISWGGGVGGWGGEAGGGGCVWGGGGRLWESENGER